MAAGPPLTFYFHEPMLVDIGLELIVRAPAVVGPEIRLPKTHLIEHLRGQTRLVVGQLFRIAKNALRAHDHARFAPQEIGSPAVSECQPIVDPDDIARLKLRRARQMGASVVSQGTCRQRARGPLLS